MGVGARTATGIILHAPGIYDLIKNAEIWATNSEGTEPSMGTG